RVYAQEMLSVTVAPELRRFVFPLFADLAPEQRLQRLAAAFPQRALAALDRLAALVAPAVPTGDPWLRACALAAAAHGGARLVPGVVAAIDDPQPLVRETALRTLARLDRLDCARQVDRLATDADAQVTQAVRAIEAE